MRRVAAGGIVRTAIKFPAAGLAADEFPAAVGFGAFDTGRNRLRVLAIRKAGTA